MNTKVLQCPNNHCTNEYQDAEYGKGNRVMNLVPKKGWACTVCNPRKRFGGQTEPTIRENV